MECIKEGTEVAVATNGSVVTVYTLVLVIMVVLVKVSKNKVISTSGIEEFQEFSCLWCTVHEVHSGSNLTQGVNMEQGEPLHKVGGCSPVREGAEQGKGVLKRSIKTCWMVLEQMDLMRILIVNLWHLNNRHYGMIQGLSKQETVDKHSKNQVLVWRRSYGMASPALDDDNQYYPGNDPTYTFIDKKDLPFAESLKITKELFMPNWENTMVPVTKEVKKLLIAVHRNTLPVLVKHLDGISKDEICGLNIPFGVLLIYELDGNLKPIPHPDAILPLQECYLRGQDSIKTRIGTVSSQTK
eukprot:15365675-Ditylum_brightwellii.AAC.1